MATRTESMHALPERGVDCRMELMVNRAGSNPAHLPGVEYEAAIWRNYKSVVGHRNLYSDTSSTLLSVWRYLSPNGFVTPASKKGQS